MRSQWFARDSTAPCLAASGPTSEAWSWPATGAVFKKSVWRVQKKKVFLYTYQQYLIIVKCMVKCIVSSLYIYIFEYVHVPLSLSLSLSLSLCLFFPVSFESCVCSSFYLGNLFTVTFIVCVCLCRTWHRATATSSGGWIQKEEPLESIGISNHTNICVETSLIKLLSGNFT